MAQKIEAHCWYELNAWPSPYDPEWVVDEAGDRALDDRRLHHPDRMTVVQWGDREPGEGIGDYAPYSAELERVKDCIKFPLPYLSKDEKVSFLDEALSRVSALVHELQTERAKAVAQMTDPASPSVVAGGEETDQLVPSLPKRARDEFERDFNTTATATATRP